MNVNRHEIGGITLAHVTATDAPIKTTQDAFPIIVGHGREVAGIAIDEACFDPDFFRLKTGIAGELLQMFTNYRVMLAIVGEVAKYPGDSLRAFVRECNRGRHVFFVSTVDEAAHYFHSRADRAPDR
jgi:hypothetical protein